MYSNLRIGTETKYIATTPENNPKRRKVVTLAGRPKSDKSENISFELMKKFKDEHTQKSIPEWFRKCRPFLD